MEAMGMIEIGHMGVPILIGAQQQARQEDEEEEESELVQVMSRMDNLELQVWAHFNGTWDEFKLAWCSTWGHNAKSKYHGLLSKAKLLSAFIPSALSRTASIKDS